VDQDDGLFVSDIDAACENTDDLIDESSDCDLELDSESDIEPYCEDEEPACCLYNWCWSSSREQCCSTKAIAYKISRLQLKEVKKA
jgi:hypothetical protein